MNNILINEVLNKNKNYLTQKREYLFNNFFKYLDVSAKTVETYSKALRQMFKYFSEHGVNNPNREDIIFFKKDLEERNLKHTTIALYLASARRFFAWCEATGIYANIATGIKAPRIDSGHKKDCLSATQIKEILGEMKAGFLNPLPLEEKLRNYAILTLITTCGLRTVEITRANVEDMRNVAGVTCLYIQGKGRTDKSEFVKITEPVEKAIREYLKTRGNVKGNEPLFTSCSKRNYGGRLTTRTISGICKQAMKKAGFNSPLLTAHSLRHSAVTLALIAGESLSDVQAFARHKSLNTTMIYAHNVNRLKSLCEQSISNAIF